MLQEARNFPSAWALPVTCSRGRVLCGSCESGVSQACLGLFAENALPGQPPRWRSPMPCLRKLRAESGRLPTERCGAGVQILHSLLGHTLLFSHNDALCFTALGHGEFLTLSQALQCPGNQSGRGCFLVCSYSDRVLLPRSHSSGELCCQPH